MRKKIIGIIGPIASGKDIAAKYLSERYGIPFFQTSDRLKEVAASEKIEPTRENLIAIGVKLAQENGGDYLTKILLPKIEKMGIIIGMRQVDQIKYLKENSDCLIIAINGDPNLRFERVKARGKLGDAETLEEFVDNEKRENSGAVQQLPECMKLADYTIANNGNAENLFKALDDIIKKTNLI